MDDETRNNAAEVAIEDYVTGEADIVQEKAEEEAKGIPDYHDAFCRALHHLSTCMDRAVIAREASRTNTARRSYEAGQAEAFAMAYYFVHEAYESIRHGDWPLTWKK